MTSDELRTWTEALARQAGDMLLSFFGGTLTRTIKTHDDDFATEADVAAECLIIDAIRAQFPDDDILSEEAGFHGTHSAEYTWIIDPLDGTWNFANSVPEYGPMIVRARGEELELAVIYNPSTRQIVSAVHGEGVRMNGASVRMSLADALKTCIPVAGCIEHLPGAERVTQLRTYLESLGCTSPNWHSVAGDTLHLLSGDGHIYFGNAFKPWDFSPMDLILREAGLRVTNFSGRPLSWKKGDQDFVAAPQLLHDEIMVYLQK